MARREALLPDDQTMSEMVTEYENWIKVLQGFLSKTYLPEELKLRMLSDMFDALVDERISSGAPVDGRIEEIAAKIAQQTSIYFYYGERRKGFINFGEMVAAEADVEPELADRRIQRRIKNSPSPFEVVFGNYDDEGISRLEKKRQLLMRIRGHLMPEDLRFFKEQHYYPGGKLRGGQNLERKRKVRLIKLKVYFALRREIELQPEESFLESIGNANVELVTQWCGEENTPAIVAENPRVLEYDASKLERNFGIIAQFCGVEKVAGIARGNPAILTDVAARLRKRFDIIVQFCGRETVAGMVEKDPLMLGWGARQLRRFFNSTPAQGATDSAATERRSFDVAKRWCSAGEFAEMVSKTPKITEYALGKLEERFELIESFCGRENVSKMACGNPHILTGLRCVIKSRFEAIENLCGQEAAAGIVSTCSAILSLSKADFIERFKNIEKACTFRDIAVRIVSAAPGLLECPPRKLSAAFGVLEWLGFTGEGIVRLCEESPATIAKVLLVEPPLVSEIEAILREGGCFGLRRHRKTTFESLPVRRPVRKRELNINI